ncbi:MAG: hypothetical protein IKT00_04130 [Prevotella sp.]|nr:hypothetical protein [Prevotella sp.]
MKKLLIFLLVLVLLVVGFIFYMGCDGKADRPSEEAMHTDSAALKGMTFKTYENNKFGYSIEYPDIMACDTSSIASELDIVRIELPDKSMNNLTIEVKEKPKGWSAEERKAEFDQTLAEVEAFSPGSEFKDGEWMYMYDFDDVIPIHEMMRVVYRGDRRYQITYTYDSEGESSLAAGRVHCIQSFKLRN